MTTAVGAAAGGREATRGAVRWSTLALIAIVAIGVYVLAQNTAIFLHNTGLQPGAGRLGLALTFETDHPGWDRLSEVDPHGAIARAGLRVGDEVRFEDRVYPYKAFPAGERVPMTVRRAGVERSLTVTALPIRSSDAGADSPRFQYIAFALSSVLPVLFGLFITARSRRRLLPMLLGLCLIGQGAGVIAEMPFWYTTAPAIRFGIGLWSVISWLSEIASVAFAMSFAPDGPRRLAWFDWIVLLLFAPAAGGVWLLWNLTGDIAFTPPMKIANGVLIGVYLTAAWLRCPPASRSRFTLLLVGFALLMVLPAVRNALGEILRPEAPVQTVLTLMTLLFSSLLAPLLLAYAILRQRVLDLGFAVNRTLVYGVVSALLLAAFGLVEWAVEHFLPASVRETSVIIDALVALAVFLAFHRVRDFAEHLIESLFFRRWQEAEASFRSFVRQAAFVTQADALTKAFAEALARYADGAETAVYFRREDGAYHRASGDVAGVGEKLDPDDAALVAVRAEPKPLAPDPATSKLTAALIAPMINRNEVIGLALLGPKPTGLDYRPDEIELVGWATRQVGLDLHALTVEQLVNERSELRSANAQLERLLLSTTRA
jgi:hypothetical protein